MSGLPEWRSCLTWSYSDATPFRDKILLVQRALYLNPPSWGSLFAVQALLTHPCLTGGSLGNDLDKHIGDGLEVDAGDNLQVLETKSVIEESENLGDGFLSDAENIT